MRIFYIIATSVLLLCSCVNKSHKSGVPEHDFLTVTEYNNEYDNNGVIKTKTVREGEDVLYVKRYVANGEEMIELSGDDTTRYSYREYDEAGRMIREIKKDRVNVPEFDFYIDDNYDERIRYDSAGKRREIARTDRSTGEVKRTLFFYDEEPNVAPTPLCDIVCYYEKAIGDTILTGRYENDTLTDVFKKYKEGNSAWELTLSPAGDLISSIETIDGDGTRTVVTKLPELQSVDSVFYVNNREIKSVVVSPDEKITVIIEYDDHGNVVRESRYTKFHNNVMAQ